MDVPRASGGPTPNKTGNALQNASYFEIWISSLFLTRASQFTDKCPELYLEE